MKSTKGAKAAAMQIVYGGKFSFDTPLPKAGDIAPIIDEVSGLKRLRDAAVALLAHHRIRDLPSTTTLTPRLKELQDAIDQVQPL